MIRPETQRSQRGHDFYPDAGTLALVPKLYETETTPTRNKVIYLHYFVGGCDWWLVEYDPAEALGFGYVCLGDPVCAEWGLVPLDELEAVRVPLRGAFDGLSVVVERDLHWRPVAVQEVDLPGWAP